MPPDPLILGLVCLPVMDGVGISRVPSQTVAGDENIR